MSFFGAKSSPSDSSGERDFNVLIGGYETPSDTDGFLHGVEESGYEDEEREQSPTHLSPQESGFSDLVRGYGNMAYGDLEQ